MSDTQTGWQHFADADWAAARDAFAAALEDEPGDPEALDGLGQSLWWLGERDAGIDRRREAYAAYQRRGDAAQRRPARRPTSPASTASTASDAAAAGWLARARRLLAGAGTVARARLAGDRGGQARGRPGRGRARTPAPRSTSRTSSPTPTSSAWRSPSSAARSCARAASTRASALLDEAMTVALGGETSDPLACGDACCTTLVVCDGLADLQRAAQWCEAVVEFTERRRFTPGPVVVPRHLRRACSSARATGSAPRRCSPRRCERRADRRRGGGRALPLAVLAELRLRQGRSEEAERLLAGLEDEPAALAPLVQLHLRARRPARSRAALLDRRARPAATTATCSALRGAVALADGDLDGAAAAAERLRDARRARSRATTCAPRRRCSRAASPPRAATPPRPPRELEEAVGRLRRAAASRSRRPARGSRSPRVAGGGGLAARARRRARGARRLRAARRARATPTAAAALLRELGAAGRTRRPRRARRADRARARGARARRGRPVERARSPSGS